VAVAVFVSSALLRILALAPPPPIPSNPLPSALFPPSNEPGTVGTVSVALNARPHPKPMTTDITAIAVFRLTNLPSRIFSPSAQTFVQPASVTTPFSEMIAGDTNGYLLKFNANP
jgi:hypothetical protein